MWSVISWGFLGGFVSRATFVEQKVEQGVSNFGCLKISMTQPQVAFAVLTKSLQCEWCYLQGIVPDCSTLFVPLNQMLFNNFIPTLFGCDASSLEQ